MSQSGLSKQLTKRMRDKVEEAEEDVSRLVAGERPVRDQQWMDKYSKACPNCSVPIEKNGE